MKKLLVIGFLFLGTTLVFSQDLGSIRGTITDFEMQNEPLLFANVALKDSSVKVQTNFHGNFEISDITPGSYTLVISYLGYENLELPVTVEMNKTTIIQKSLQAKSIDVDIILPSDMPVVTNSRTETTAEANFR